MRNQHQTGIIRRMNQKWIGIIHDSHGRIQKKNFKEDEEASKRSKKNQRMQKITTDTILISVFIEIGLYKVQKMSFYTKL